MSSAVSSPVPPGELMFRLSVDQYHQMINSGTLSTDDPVELVEGILLYTMPKKPSHTGTVNQVRRLIEPVLPSGWRYRSQEPVTLEDGEPEPDGAVCLGELADDFVAHPVASQVGLIIEVSDTTLDRDRGIKLRSYARARIGCYWIINLADLLIEVYTAPTTNEKIPFYSEAEIYSGGMLIPLILNGQKVAEFSASALLPPV
jgi:hypothetical protein